MTAIISVLYQMLNLSKTRLIESTQNKLFDRVLTVLKSALTTQVRSCMSHRIEMCGMFLV